MPNLMPVWRFVIFLWTACLLLLLLLLCSFPPHSVVVDAVAVPATLPVKKSQPVAPLSIVQTLVAGGSARAISQFVTYPMDALRTISQTRQGAKTLSELGMSKLVAGSVSTSLFAFPLGAVQFTVFGNVKKILSSLFRTETGAIGTAVAMTSSACASLASCAVGVPQEVLKQRLVTNIYPNFGTAVRTIWNTEGLMGFYQGWGPTVARNLPYIVITFTTFNHWKTQELKKRSTARGGDETKNDGSSTSKVLDTKTALRFGMGAAFIGCLATQPLDVIKTRMMTQAASNLPPYSGALNCVQDIIATEGVSAFLAGLPPRVCYISPLWGAQFLLNEKFQKMMGVRNYHNINKRNKTAASSIVRGPSPGPGRSAWVKHQGFVWTVGVPTGRSPTADIATQTQLALDSIDARLAQAGTDKTKILETTVFLTNIKDEFREFDTVFSAWLPEGSGASRATVGVAELANNDKVEIKVTVAAAS
mmetsp:Transcript_19671/g.21763  ORF Transcript_19671/g.21763 Transcript_19671/m.21763 type:complete len:476 (+) Transcript_19671:74-1501(+)